MKTIFVAIAFILFSLSAFAGDLENLPDNEVALQEKIEKVIKPGSSIKDAVSLLEASRFKCEKLNSDENTIWCDRTDGNSLSSVIRRYQVVLITKEAVTELERPVRPSCQLL